MPYVARSLGAEFVVEVCQCRSQIGSGALPLDTIESTGLSIRALIRGGAIEDLGRRLRGLPTPVIGRIEKDRLVLDFRCLTDEQAFLSNLAHLRNDATTSMDPPPSESRVAPEGQP